MFTTYFKKAIFYALAAMLTVCSVSCSSNDDNDDKDPEPAPIGQANIKAKVGSTDLKFTLGAADVEDNGLIFSTGPSNQVNGKTATIAFVVPAAEGTYEYNTPQEGSGDDATVMLTYLDFDGGVWSSVYPGGKAKVTITKIDRGTKKVSGTFSGTVLYGMNGASSTTITSGTFTDVTLLH